MTEIKGYFKKDGSYVKPHQDKRSRVMGWIKKRTPHLAKLLGIHDEPVDDSELEPGDEGGLEAGHTYPKAVLHPSQDDDGHPVVIKHPSVPTAKSSWADKGAIATFVPGGEVPKELNGVPFSSWVDAPETAEEWDAVDGQDHLLVEPPFDAFGKPATGVVVEEPDGRVWIIHPTNAFGGYEATFPKGRLEDGIGMQASAIKEAFEESGLRVEITGFLADIERSVTTCRYYTARRVGGTPKDAGWESQAVSLVPRSQLYDVLNSSNDHPLAEQLGAGPQPPKPEKPKWSTPSWGSAPKSSGNWSGGAMPKSNTPKPSMPPPILQKKSS